MADAKLPHQWLRSAKQGCVSFLVLAAGIWALIYTCSPTPHQPPSLDVINEATTFWEQSIPALISSGFIESYKTDGTLLIVYVPGESWKPTPFEKKKKLVRLISSSHEIIGKTPWVEIRDYQSGKIYAEVKPFGINVHE